MNCTYPIVLYVQYPPNTPTLNNLAPLYLTELLSFRNLSRTLRSCAQALLMVPRSRLKLSGDRAFCCGWPQVLE